MNCVIVDDNKMARVALKQLVNEVDFLTLVGDCESMMEAINIINKEKVDLLLLDVEMPKMSGLDFLRTTTNRPLVILITSGANYAVEAFEHNVVDFIVKPFQVDRFLKAIHIAKEMFDASSIPIEINEKFFFVREKGVSRKVNIDDILFIQALGDYVTINTINKKYTIHFTLSSIEKKLPTTKFMRVHRSYIAALDKIDSFEEGSAFIQQTPVPVGDAQRPELLKRLNLL